ncbi:hypothetical protein MM440_11085 [Arsenicicoccus piscis]|uniref:Uncharacterized protein n=1 Tax=Arsenicicoccus piscis TaxID=673954 RepID=A0ABQ6HJD5_9MICO|nr:hypothetical protein [Arsenicicoccus piscis]MCH8628304.1 hypothetical protein [Arsenicicoccus piscis]GMA18565.1 hypothetical protein GCM10025862_05860 [Arsenicicoccus piscis]
MVDPSPSAALRASARRELARAEALGAVVADLRTHAVAVGDPTDPLTDTVDEALEALVAWSVAAEAEAHRRAQELEQRSRTLESADRCRTLLG